jgi:hypothetical protein
MEFFVCFGTFFDSRRTVNKNLTKLIASYHIDANNLIIAPGEAEDGGEPLKVAEIVTIALNYRVDFIRFNVLGFYRGAD